MNNIVLINPTSPFLKNDAVFPPLGLLYLAGAVDAQVIDLALDEYIPPAKNYGITATTPQINEAISLAKKLDGIKILGGAHISGMETLPEGFDIGVVGPGEKALTELIEQNFSQRGIIKGGFTPTKPNRSIIDLGRYHYLIDDILATTMMTSFGCPFKCAFCSKPIFGQKVYYQSLVIIQQEIDDIKHLGFDAIMLFDDNFLLHPQVSLISQYIKEKNMIYRCFVQTRFINTAVVERLAKTGCKAVGIGIESGSDRILKKINKPATVQENLFAIRLLKQSGIKVKGFFILGLPSENETSIDETEHFLKEAELDDIDITIYVPYPKSPLWNKEWQNTDSRKQYENYWYKGKPGKYNAFISTETLSATEIMAKRDTLESNYKKG